MTPADPWMTADEAARHLGVSRATLYAYVSRGLLQREADPAGGPGARRSRYRADTVLRLAAQRRAARNPRQAAQATLDWGLPVLSSALTLIENGRLHYCGQDAEALAGTATLEDVAALLWQVDAAGLARAAALPGVLAAEPEARLLAPWRRAAEAGPTRSLAAMQGLLAVQALQSPAPATDLTRSPAAEALALLSTVRAATTQRAVPSARLRAAPLHRRLQAVWKLDNSQADLVRRALVLCADHELNASSFTARCVAATGAGLGACVLAGLGALSGPRHGGVTARLEVRWPEWMAAATDARRLRRLVAALAAPPDGGPGCGASRESAFTVGFGHPLYPQGDPRARHLLERLMPNAQVTRLLREVQTQAGWAPTIDFALVALRHALGLPEGAAFALFAIGRTVGWIAHALEQRDQGSLIRPRAAYVGERPVVAVAAEPAGRVVRRR